MNTSESNAAISIRQLCFSYASEPVLKDINIDVKTGSVFALLGGNGAGKSTLIQLILGLIQPQSGSIRVMGLDPQQNPAEVRQKLAYVPETVAVYAELTGMENVAYFMQLVGSKTSTADIERVFKQVSLPQNSWHQRASSYSKGMRQKLIIAVALLRSVPLVLLDEPNSGLDPKATAELNQLIKNLRNAGITVLMVSHDLVTVAEIADGYAFLQDAKVQRAGTLEEKTRADLTSFRLMYTRNSETVV